VVRIQGGEQPMVKHTHYNQDQVNRYSRRLKTDFNKSYNSESRDLQASTVLIQCVSLPGAGQRSTALLLGVSHKLFKPQIKKSFKAFFCGLHTPSKSPR
jgi:hypothetical protein